jgi:hypothetical protein
VIFDISEKQNPIKIETIKKLDELSKTINKDDKKALAIIQTLEVYNIKSMRGYFLGPWD